MYRSSSISWWKAVSLLSVSVITKMQEDSTSHLNCSGQVQFCWLVMCTSNKKRLLSEDSDSNIARIAWNYKCSTTLVVLMVFFSQLTRSTIQFQKGTYSEDPGDLHSCSTLPSPFWWLGEETRRSLGRTHHRPSRQGDWGRLWGMSAWTQ
jgi:hypothetical protein